MSYYLKCDSPFGYSDAIPKRYFQRDYPDRNTAISVATEAMPDDGAPVYVINRDTGEVVWDSSKAEFEDDEASP